MVCFSPVGFVCSDEGLMLETSATHQKQTISTFVDQTRISEKAAENYFWDESDKYILLDG